MIVLDTHIWIWWLSLERRVEPEGGKSPPRGSPLRS